jgi:hypothetical protein
LPGREASGCGANPLDGVVDVQVPQPGRPVGVADDQGMPVGAECHQVQRGGAAGQGPAERPQVPGVGADTVGMLGFFRCAFPMAGA